MTLPTQSPDSAAAESPPRRSVAEHVAEAAELVAGACPEALAAVLGGSSARGQATPASDLDIAVLLPDGATSRRESLVHRGRAAEVFLYTRADLRALFEVERVNRQRIVLAIWAHSVPVTDPDGHGAAVRDEARAIVDAGPVPLSERERTFARHRVTHLLDDLVRITGHSENRYEQLAVADRLLRDSMMGLCGLRTAWSGQGKWLPRALLAADPVLGRALLDGHLTLVDRGDPGPMTDAVGALLAELGGPLREGYVQVWRGAAAPRL